MNEPTVLHEFPYHDAKIRMLDNFTFIGKYDDENHWEPWSSRSEFWETAFEMEHGKSTSLQIEHDRAIMFLRGICAEVGDNDWPDDLDLSDIIDKHLMRYIHSD